MHLFARSIGVGVLLVLTAAAAAAQGDARNFPDRAVRIIVPFPAGGPTDILARVIG